MSQPSDGPLPGFMKRPQLQCSSHGLSHLVSRSLTCSPSLGWRDPTVSVQRPPLSGSEGPFSARGSQVPLQCSDSEQMWLLEVAQVPWYFLVIKLFLSAPPLSKSFPPAQSQNWTSYPTDSTNVPSTAGPAIPISQMGHQRHQMKPPGLGHTAGVWWAGSQPRPLLPPHSPPSEHRPAG